MSYQSPGNQESAILMKNSLNNVILNISFIKEWPIGCNKHLNTWVLLDSAKNKYLYVDE